MAFASVKGPHISGSLVLVASVVTLELHVVVEALYDVLSKGVVSDRYIIFSVSQSALMATYQ